MKSTPFLLAASAVLCAGLCSAHPASLECGTDQTSRMQIGQVVMGGAVAAGSPADGVQVAYDAKSGAVGVVAPKGFYFAVKMFGGDLKTTNPNLVATSNCTSQFYTTTGNGGLFNLTASLSSTSAPYIAVGYSNSGPPGMKLLTTEDSNSKFASV
jgi:hypothetical protein